MLQIALKDQTSSDLETDDPIYCAACGHLLTRERWGIDINGHERVFINPAGHVFRIRLFDHAPGSHNIGEPTSEHSWFTDHEWSISLCRACNTHIGWCFSGDAAPREFFGLIKSALTSDPGGSQASAIV